MLGVRQGSANVSEECQEAGMFFGGMKNGALDLPNWNMDDDLEVSLNHKDYHPERPYLKGITFSKPSFGYPC